MHFDDTGKAWLHIYADYSKDNGIQSEKQLRNAWKV